MRNPNQIFSRAVIILVAAITLAACGKSVTGTYEGQGMAKGATYTFQSGGKGIADLALAKFEFKYEIDGTNLKMTMAQGGPAAIFTIKDDNTLIGPMDQVYTKK